MVARLWLSLQNRKPSLILVNAFVDDSTTNSSWLLTFPDVVVDPFDEGGHTREDGRTVGPGARNLGPAGHSVQFPVAQRAIHARQRTARIAGARAATALDVSGTDHVVRQEVGVPRRLVARRPVEQRQLHFVQLSRRFSAL